MTEGKQAYRWSTPQDWLAERAKDWDRDTLYASLLDLACKVDCDTVQDIFQTEMDRDGYFIGGAGWNYA